MLLLIFSFGSVAAANMALTFVDVQNFTHLMEQRRLDNAQPLADVFVYGAFADFKHLSGRPNRRSRI